MSLQMSLSLVKIIYCTLETVYRFAAPPLIVDAITTDKNFLLLNLLKCYHSSTTASISISLGKYKTNTIKWISALIRLFKKHPSRCYLRDSVLFLRVLSRYRLLINIDNFGRTRFNKIMYRIAARRMKYLLHRRFRRNIFNLYEWVVFFRVHVADFTRHERSSV